MAAALFGDETDLVLVERLVAAAAAAGRAFVEQADVLTELLRRADHAGTEDDMLALEVGCALRIRTVEATERLIEAETLAARPLTRTALLDGTITVRHAQVIVAETRGLTAGQAEEVERWVLRRAPEQTASQLRGCVRRAVIRADAHAAERRRRQARRTAGVWLQPEPDGMALICVRMAAEQAAATMAALNAVTPKAEPWDDRLVGERTVDAFVSLVDGLLALGLPGKRGARAAVQVTVPFATAVGLSEEPCELKGYGPITAQAGRELLANADLRRVCVDELTGQVVAVDSRTTSTGPGPQPRTRPGKRRSAARAAKRTSRREALVPVTGGDVLAQLLAMLEPVVLTDLSTDAHDPGVGLTRLVRTRDVTCTFPFCTVPAERCDLEHEVPWPWGRTDRHNVDCKCRRHHRAKQAGWQPNRQRDGSTLWLSPTGARYRSWPPGEPPPPIRARVTS